MRDSKKSGKQKEFKVDGTKIRDALLWLIENNPYYKFIKINETNLQEYPENGGIITDVRIIEVESNDKEKEPSVWNPNLVEDEDIRNAAHEEQEQCRKSRQY